MNTSFNVTGKKSSQINSTISHIERNHSLKKNPFSNSIENVAADKTHIIVFRKNKRYEKPKETKNSRTKISKKIQTYKSRLKKNLEELETLTDEKLIDKKQKTIQRNRDKIAELEKERDSTTKKRTGYAQDFVDIPFSITNCPPDLLSKDDFKELADIAEEVTLQLFEIDKEELGKVAHLDQSSSHVHISFTVPQNKNLKEITKISYADAQILFNQKVREVFKHLEIDEINVDDKKEYVSLTEFKKQTLENQNKSLQEQKKVLEVKVHDLEKKNVSKQSIEQEIDELKDFFGKNEEKPKNFFEWLKNKFVEMREYILELKEENEVLQKENFKLKANEVNSYLNELDDELFEDDNKSSNQNSRTRKNRDRN